MRIERCGQARQWMQGGGENTDAAHALAARAVLVTHDRVFHRVKQLKLEDWTKLH